MTTFDFILNNIEKSKKRIKDRERLKEDFLNQHPDHDELVKKCLEVKKIVKKMKKDFKPNRKSELYKNEIEAYILDCILYLIEKK